MNYRLSAVIDVGSTSIRMMIAQINLDGSVLPLDELCQGVAIGKDTFTHGRISRNTVEDCVKVLRSFLVVINEYGINLQKDVRAVATSAVREAGNRDEFLDRLYIATNINVTVIKGTDVNWLTFLAIRPLLAAHEELRKGSLLVAEAGGGSTELLGLQKGYVAFTHTYRLGAYRLHESIHALPSSTGQQMELLEIEVKTALRQVQSEVGMESSKGTLLLLGGDARFAAKWMDQNWDEKSLIQLRVQDLKRLTEHVLHSSAESLIREYNLTLEDAQTLGPALQIYLYMAKEFGLKKVCVCGVSLRDGLLAQEVEGNVWSKDVSEQILYSARELGRRYAFDENHATVVADLAVRLYEAMQAEHQLDPRFKIILHVAALVHDIGAFIDKSAHHKHSQYIIDHSEIFGLCENDLHLVALIARYHRHSEPKASHLAYAALSRTQRLILIKLASILRVADALDHSHRGFAKHLRFERIDQTVILHSDRTDNLILEKRVVAEKSKMFKQVYGYDLKLSPN